MRKLAMSVVCFETENISTVQKTLTANCNARSSLFYFSPANSKVIFINDVVTAFRVFWGGGGVGVANLFRLPKLIPFSSTKLEIGIKIRNKKAGAFRHGNVSAFCQRNFVGV